MGFVNSLVYRKTSVSMCRLVLPLSYYMLPQLLIYPSILHCTHFSLLCTCLGPRAANAQ